MRDCIVYIPSRTLEVAIRPDLGRAKGSTYYGTVLPISISRQVKRLAISEESMLLLYPIRITTLVKSNGQKHLMYLSIFMKTIKNGLCDQVRKSFIGLENPWSYMKILFFTVLVGILKEP